MCLLNFKTMGLRSWSSWFSTMMEHDSRDAVPFRHTSLSEVRDGFWETGVWITAAVPIHPKKGV